MKTILLFLFCSLPVLAQIPPAPLQWMEMAATPKPASGGYNNQLASISTGTTRTDSYWVGYFFTPGTSNIVVGFLQRRQATASTLSHTVTIFNSSGVVVSAVVNMSGVSIGQYASTSIAPTTLHAGTVYVIACGETNGDPWEGSTPMAVTLLDACTGILAAYYNGNPSSASSFDTGAANSAYSTPNLLYQ